MHILTREWDEFWTKATNIVNATHRFYSVRLPKFVKYNETKINSDECGKSIF